MMPWLKLSFPRVIASAGIVVGAVAAILIGTTDAETTAGVTHVRLTPNATVDAAVVRLADIAVVEGGSAELRQQLVGLDVADAPRPGATRQLSRRLIEFRLQLAGVDKRLFAVRGDQVLVSSATPVAIKRIARPAAQLSKATVTEAAKQCVLRRLPWDQQDIEIQLDGEVPDLPAGARGETTAELVTAWPPLGRVRVNVKVSSHNDTVTEIPVALNVRHFDNVVVTKQAVAANSVIEADDLHVDRRDVSSLANYYSSVDELLGKRARRPIRALSVVTNDSVSTTDTSSTAQGGMLIKQRDRVRIVGNAGGLTVTTVGEALQGGRENELIRVRNIDSQKVIMGRVVSRDEVRVPF